MIDEKSIDTSLILANHDGEHIDVQVSISKKRKYYTIRKINSRICDMTFAEVQTKVCKSSKKVEMFWKLLQATNNRNRFSDVSVIAKENNYDYSNLTRLVKDMIDVGFVKRIERGVYMVNPFEYLGKAVNSAESMEELQEEW